MIVVAAVVAFGIATRIAPHALDWFDKPPIEAFVRLGREDRAVHGRRVSQAKCAPNPRALVDTTRARVFRGLSCRSFCVVVVVPQTLARRVARGPDHIHSHK